MFSSLLPKPEHATHDTIPVSIIKESRRSALIVLPGISDRTKTHVIPNPNTADKTLSELHVSLDGSLDYAKTIALAQDSKVAVQATYEDTIPLKERYPNLKHHFPRYTLQNCPDKSLATCVEETRELIEKLISQSGGATEKSEGASYVNFTPSGMGDPDDGGKTIEIRDYKEDPMLPPKFKLRKNRHKEPSPPPPILKSSSNTKVTKELKDQWKIPSAVSNWKNNQGFSISLDKRVNATGMGGASVESSINVEKFSLLSLALENAHNQARDDIRIRNQRRKEQAIQEQRDKESQLRELLERTRTERFGKRPGDDLRNIGKKSRR